MGTNYEVDTSGNVTAASYAGDGSSLTSVADADAVKLQGIDISGVTPTDNQVLTYDLAGNKWQAETPAGGGGGVWASVANVLAPITSADHTLDFSGATGSDMTIKMVGGQSFVVNDSTNNILEVADNLIDIQGMTGDGRLVWQSGSKYAALEFNSSDPYFGILLNSGAGTDKYALYIGHETVWGQFETSELAGSSGEEWTHTGNIKNLFYNTGKFEHKVAAAIPLTIEATGVTFLNGTKIDEFSIDGTLAGNSDNAVPTEKAVKTYVDAATVLDIVNADVNTSAAIAQSKLALDITNSEVNASAAIAQSKLALDITNSEVNASAAIVQSKLALDITNSEINASAAIAQSKLALDWGEVGDLTAVEPDDAAAAGILDEVARADHQHAIVAAVVPDIGSANAEGSATSFARSDHVHEGAHTVKKAGDVDIHGDITLTGGTNVTLTQSGNDISIAASGGSGTPIICVNFGSAAVTYIETNLGAYAVVGHMVFPGTSRINPSNFRAVISTSASDTMDIRLYDATNAQTIAEITGQTPGTSTTLVVDSSLTNLPAGVAMFEIQALKSSGTGKVRIHCAEIE